MYKEKFQNLGLWLFGELPEELAEELWKGLFNAFEYFPDPMPVDYNKSKERAFEQFLKDCIKLDKLRETK